MSVSAAGNGSEASILMDLAGAPTSHATTPTLTARPQDLQPAPTKDQRANLGALKDFSERQYENATNEIRERLGNENVLFGLKFTLVGAIMGVLFSLFRSESISGIDFERFIQKRRAVVFFVAALLCSTIIDTRLRFNAKVVESLGDWVWCIERARLLDYQPIGWEHNLQLQLDSGSYPILRYFCHFLTALLYAMTLYLFVIMPRTINRPTKTMLTFGGVLFFAFLFFISVSYGPVWLDQYGALKDALLSIHSALLLLVTGASGPYAPDWGQSLLRSNLPWVSLAAMLAVVGWRQLAKAISIQYEVGSAFVRTKGIRHEEPALHDTLVAARLAFAVMHHKRALASELNFLARLRRGDVDLMLEKLNDLHPGVAAQLRVSKATITKVDPCTTGTPHWVLDDERYQGDIVSALQLQHTRLLVIIRSLLSRTPLGHRMARRLEKRMGSLLDDRIVRFLGRAVRKSIPVDKDYNQLKYEADLAEERLWHAFFQSRTPKTKRGTRKYTTGQPSNVLASVGTDTGRPLEQRSLRAASIELLIVPHGQSIPDNETLVRPFPLDPKRSYDAYLRIANNSLQRLKNVHGVFQGTVSTVVPPTSERKTAETDIAVTVEANNFRILAAPVAWNFLSYKDPVATICFAAELANDAMPLILGAQDDRPWVALEISDTAVFAHTLTNSSPISRHSRVVAELEHFPNEDCSLDFVHTGGDGLNLEVHCSQPSNPRGKLKLRRPRKSRVWWMTGSTAVHMTIGITLHQLAKERKLLIRHFLDGFEVSRALYYVSHRERSN